MEAQDADLTFHSHLRHRHSPLCEHIPPAIRLFFSLNSGQSSHSICVCVVKWWDWHFCVLNKPLVTYSHACIREFEKPVATPGSRLPVDAHRCLRLHKLNSLRNRENASKRNDHTCSSTPTQRDISTSTIQQYGNLPRRLPSSRRLFRLP
jgi:hypothetical protein